MVQKAQTKFKFSKSMVQFSSRGRKSQKKAEKIWTLDQNIMQGYPILLKRCHCGQRWLEQDNDMMNFTLFPKILLSQ